MLCSACCSGDFAHRETTAPLATATGLEVLLPSAFLKKGVCSVDLVFFLSRRCPFNLFGPAKTFMLLYINLITYTQIIPNHIRYVLL